MQLPSQCHNIDNAQARLDQSSSAPASRTVPRRFRLGKYSLPPHVTEDETDRQPHGADLTAIAPQ